MPWQEYGVVAGSLAADHICILVIGLHLCQLSQIIRESPGYGTNLPVSCTGDQFSRINTTLNLF